MYQIKKGKITPSPPFMIIIPCNFPKMGLYYVFDDFQYMYMYDVNIHLH